MEFNFIPFLVNQNPNHLNKKHSVNQTPFYSLLLWYLQRLDLSSVWALLAAFEEPLPLPPKAAGIPFEGAFVKGIDSISWIGNNTQKLFNSQNEGPHCWTIFSTSSFGKRHKVPQVCIPSMPKRPICPPSLKLCCFFM